MIGPPPPTPIYDKLYAEYVKSFRTLPGDRSGEEKLGFTAFGNIRMGRAR
ncbi:Secreted protein OS=Streptomyces glaucescens OX=1907 GN=SGLAU_07760 PE=4 SV=1 [Streptomyces glaucescens]